MSNSTGSVEVANSREVVAVALNAMAADWGLPQPQLAFGEGFAVFVTVATRAEVVAWATALQLAAFTPSGESALGDWQGWHVSVRIA